MNSKTIRGLNRRALSGAFGAVLLLLLSDSFAVAQSRDTVRVVYADWSSSVASAHLVCAVVRRHLQQNCELEQVAVEAMYAQVAKGEADVMLSAWLPDTHEHYYRRYADELRDLGPNFEGTRIGLVVPAVRPGRQTGPHGSRGRSEFELQSIDELNDHAERFNHRIVGIEADTGIMRATREAMDAYDLDAFRLVQGDERNMVESLQNAIQRNQAIVVTGWRPHWLFGRWALRFLDDPRGVYGEPGAIHTLVHPALAERMPRVHAFLDRFFWRSDELGQLMVWIEADAGHDPMAQVERWMRSHRDLVAQWTAPDQQR